MHDSVFNTVYVAQKICRVHTRTLRYEILYKFDVHVAHTLAYTLATGQNAARRL
jgi:hypothetical protein